MMGGTLNATTERAAEDSRREMENDRNHTILSHGGEHNENTLSHQPLFGASDDANDADTTKGSAPVRMDQKDTITPPAKVGDIQPPTATLADIDAKARTSSHVDARDAIKAAFDSSATPPTSAFPPLPDFSTLPPLPVLPTAPAPQPSVENLGNIIPPSVAPAASTPAKPADPGQFKIPGQS
jgi:hypothetical protein